MQQEIIVSIPCPDWQTALPEAEALVRQAAAAALAYGAPATTRPLEVGVRLSDDAEVRALNRDYRGRDRATNVLSFPGDDDFADTAGAGSAGEAGRPLLLGDVILAFGVVKAEAEAQHKTMTAHVCHLTVHGMLHLLGYDHEDDADAEVMEAAERIVLAGLGLPDPYAVTEDGPVVQENRNEA